MNYRIFPGVIFCLMFAFGILFVSANANASSLEHIFKDANTSFGNGDYKTAIDKYKELEKLGVYSETLFYNRATAEARVGNLGRAIQYYERVLKLAPSNEDTIHNLKVIRNYIAKRANREGRDADLAPASGPWRTILDRFTSTSASVAFLVFYVLFFVFLVLRWVIRGELLRLSLNIAIGIMLVLWLSVGAIVLGKRNQVLNVKEAIVLSQDGILRPVYEGPNPNVVRYSLEEGSRVQILDTSKEYYKIQDDQGRDGWILKRTLGRI